MTGRREQGAVFVEAGLWLRAQYFPRRRGRLAADACDREAAGGARAASASAMSRRSGKIDIQGADAGAFLDRLYVNTLSTLPSAAPATA